MRPKCGGESGVPGRGSPPPPQPTGGEPGFGRKHRAGRPAPGARRSLYLPAPAPSPRSAQRGQIRFRSSLINFLFNVTGPHCGRGKHVTQAINLRLWRLRPPPRSRARGGLRRAGRDGPSRTPAADPPCGRCCATLLPTRVRGRPPLPALRLSFQRAFVCGLEVGTLISPHPPREAFCIANACY